MIDKLFDVLFVTFAAIFFLMMVGSIATLGMCIVSGDRGSMACWLISNRVELGVEHR